MERLFEHACKTPIRYKTDNGGGASLLLNPKDLSRALFLYNGLTFESRLSRTNGNVYRQLYYDPDGSGFRNVESVCVDCVLPDFGELDFTFFQYIPVSMLGLKMLPQVFLTEQLNKIRLDEKRKAVKFFLELDKHISITNRILNSIAILGIISRNQQLPLKK